MCLIAHRPEGGSNLPNRVFEYNARSNPDGFGVAWREGGRLFHKRFDQHAEADFRDFVKEIDKTSVEYTAHWRKATHGPICTEMSHPFSYEDKKDGEVLVFHNGIISMDNIPSGMSDTAHFVKSVLSQIQPRWWANSAYRFLIEESTGWSRFLIMTQTETIRLNENAWSKLGGIWYSTTPYPEAAGKTTYTSSGGATASSKSAQSSWQTYAQAGATGSEEDEEEDEYALLYDDTRSDDSGFRFTGWPHQGHWVRPLTQEDDLAGNDVYGAATCTSCATLGEYYVIDGKHFIDVAHDWDDNPPAHQSAATTGRSIIPITEASRALVPYSGNN